MKNIILIFALIANAASAQYMHFRIIADHDHNMLSSSYNDSMQWYVFVDDLYEPSETPEFEPLGSYDCVRGSTVLNYRTYTLGTHHLLLRNKVSGQNIAYAVLHIDRTTRRVTNERFGLCGFSSTMTHTQYMHPQKKISGTPLTLLRGY